MRCVKTCWEHQVILLLRFLFTKFQQCRCCATFAKSDENNWLCRPDYKKLGVLKQQFPDVPIMALTATATQRVCDDLKAMLRIEACETFSASINRPNLLYEVG